MSRNLLLICEEEDILTGAAKRLKPMLGDCPTFVMTKLPQYLAQLELYCTQKNIHGILCSNEDWLKTYLKDEKATLANYAGSHYYHKFKDREVEIVFMNPLAHMNTVPYGKFLIERWVRKLVEPKTWFPTPGFKFNVLTAVNLGDCVAHMDSCLAAAIDIETKKEHLRIDMYSVTTINGTPEGGYELHTYVQLIRTPDDLLMMRKLMAHPCRKILQNGKYDASYLSRWWAPMQNYIFDTKVMMHAWYAELPKDLGFLQAFFVRTAAYWKDMAESDDLAVRMEYNGRDTWGTAAAFLAMMWEAPDFVLRNFTMKMPLIHASHYCEMLGIKQDMPTLEKAQREAKAEIEQKEKDFQVLLGVPGFNVGSHVQKKQLMTVLGCGDLAQKSSDEKTLKKVAFRHPVNAFIVDKILEIMRLRKLESTYFQPKNVFEGRLLYALNPDGTDTGRNSSKGHHFWIGNQIQNVPSSAKASYVADDGFFMAECDKEQAESRYTGYISGDPNLIDAVENSPDFHSYNAASFFGYKFEQIYDVKAGKVLMKPLRTLSKRVNHGANYNMKENTLVDTMGEEAVWEAKRLLNLTQCQTAPQVAGYLLGRFAATYPVVRYDYQDWIKTTVAQTKMLVGATGWTRICFSDPRTSHPALNAYIAHNPQSLSAMLLDEYFLDVFYNIAMHEEHRHNFRLYAQIHDSIFFQYREGHEYLCDEVAARSTRKVKVTDIKGVTREFSVPVALKIGKKDANGNLVRARRWSETE